LSIRDKDVHVPGDANLPEYDAELSSKISQLSRPQILQLGPEWQRLHKALGNHGGDNVLGFLAAGGEQLPPLEGAEASLGRYFAPALVGKLHSAFENAAAQIAPGLVRRMLRRATPVDPVLQAAYERALKFLGETVEAGRGIIVHTYT
jgi:hypothetical protein